MRTRARAVAVVIAGLMLAACGNIHPGAAAVVDGRSISMKSFDKTAKIYCTFDLASAKNNGATSPSNVEVRRQAISGIVTALVARKVAAAKGVTPKPQSYVLTGEQHDPHRRQRLAARAGRTGRDRQGLLDLSRPFRAAVRPEQQAQGRVADG